MSAVSTTDASQTGAPPLGRAARDARWRRLVIRYQGGDRAAGEQLVAETMPLVRHLAGRWSAKVGIDDLIQAGLLGLTKALDRSTPRKGASFTGYAVPTMLGEMRRHLRDHAWAVRVPRALQEEAMRVTRAIQVLEPKLGRSPTPQEIADHLEIDLETVDRGDHRRPGVPLVLARAADRRRVGRSDARRHRRRGGRRAGAQELGVLLGHVRHVLDERER